MKILLFSDPHLSADTPRHAKQLQQALHHAWHHHPDASLQVILGDLAHHGDDASYQQLKNLVEETGEDFMLLIGNHDNRDNFLHRFPQPARHFAPFAQYLRNLGGMDIYCLDSHVPGEDGGSLGQGRLLWLAEQLSTRIAPALLFLHHPPVSTHLPGFDAIALREQSAFSDLVATHKERISGIFFGHCHVPVTTSLHGIPVCGIPSTAIQNQPVFDRIDFVSDSKLPLSYNVAWLDHNSLTLHQVPFGFPG